MHSRMVRTAEIIFFSRASRSAGVACRRETVDLADEMGKQGPENVKARHTRPAQTVWIRKGACSLAVGY